MLYIKELSMEWQQCSKYYRKIATKEKLMALVNKNMQVRKADIINTFHVLLGNAGHLIAQLGTMFTPSKHQVKASK